MKPLLPQNKYPEFKLLKKIKEAEPITHLQSLLLMNFTNSAYAFISFFFVRKNLIWLQPLKAWDIIFFCFFYCLWQWLSPLAWLFLIMSKGEKRLCYFVIFFLRLLVIKHWFMDVDFAKFVAFDMVLIWNYIYIWYLWILGYLVLMIFFVEYYWVLVVGYWGFYIICGV